MPDSLRTSEDCTEQNADSIYYEWIDGIAYAMSNTPSYFHQIIQHELTKQLESYFKEKHCQVIPAPFTVILTDLVEHKRKTELIPDISVICDRSKLNPKSGAYRGAPSLVVEIASPSIKAKDLGEKRLLYQQAGIKEYLFIEHTHEAHLFTLNGAMYEETIYESEDGQNLAFSIPSFPGIMLELSDDWFWFEGVKSNAAL